MEEEDITYSAREILAKLINAKSAENIIFTSGSTESLNLAVKGLNLENKHVISTVVEHNSVLRPLKMLERDSVIELSLVECDETGFVDASLIEKEVRPDSKALVINHASNVTGRVQDLEAISKICKTHNMIFIVDASQTIGAAFIDVEKCGIDILAFTGHKFLGGIEGIGGVYIRPGVELQPLKTGGTGVRSEILYQPKEIPLYYEAGTPNLPGIISMKAGAEFIFKEGIRKIEKRKEELFLRVERELSNIPEIVLYGTAKNEERLPILCFNFRGLPPDDSGYILENSFGVIIRSGLHCAPLIHKFIGTAPKGCLRMSLSYFTTEDEINIFMEAVKEISNSL